MKKFLIVIITTSLSWIGLSGLSDGIIEWRDWYEIGVMEHWRSVRTWISGNILFWLPFHIPNWIIDSVLVGNIVLKSCVVAVKMKITPDEFENQNQRDESKQRTADWPHILNQIALVLLSLAFLPLVLIGWGIFWPIVLLIVVLNVIANTFKKKLPVTWRSEIIIASGDPKDVLKSFSLTILLFVPFLFMVTNELPQVISNW